MISEIRFIFIDVDECSARAHTCGQRDQCVNTRGSFRCIKLECPDGYRLIEDAKKYLKIYILNFCSSIIDYN